MDYKHEIGIVGLGRMGFRVGERLRDKGYRVVGFDPSEESKTLFKQEYMLSVNSLEELCANLKKPRVIMLVVPAGRPVDDSIHGLIPFSEKDDVLLDCGNSYHEDAITRSVLLDQHGIHFMDIGVSGGISGARNGSCLTIGGCHELFERLEYLFKDLSAENGYFYVGPIGWGHLVKIIHNGIEYGFLQAIGELRSH